jgi:hypothetical protein
MRTTRGAYVVLAALVLALTACSGNSEEPDATPGADATSAAPTDEVSPGGTLRAWPVTNLLDWHPVEADPKARVVTDGELVAVVASGGESVELSGARNVTVRAGEGRRVTDVLLSDEYAVVVAQDELEEQPMRFTLLRTSTGATRELPGLTPTPGGPVTLSGDQLTYPMIDDERYCLVSYDVGTQTGRTRYCAPEHHGFSHVTSSPAGLALMTFDDRRPVSCRTLATLADDDTVTPLAGVPSCKGWDVLAVPDGVVWSTLPKEQQVERGAFYARADGQVYVLGTGVSSSLTWCGDSAYFVRDAQKGGKAQLLRWTPEHRLEIAYESPGRGEAFLQAPRCGGSVLTLSAYGEGGDEQVSATVPG